MAAALTVNQHAKLGDMYAWAPVTVPTLPPTPEVPGRLSLFDTAAQAVVPVGPAEGTARMLSLIHISEPTRLGMISYAVFC